jgi:hypothetical protein
MGAIKVQISLMTPIDRRILALVERDRDTAAIPMKAYEGYHSWSLQV